MSLQPLSGVWLVFLLFSGEKAAHFGREEKSSFPLAELSGRHSSGNRLRDSPQAVFTSQRPQLLMATEGKNTREDERIEKN